ncbi:MAG TPA: hypothetical protein VM345_12730 [Acidimicrobiales bacterium]|nr:hypothetical protein [Acidimicrobiales bacterium]
MTGAEREESPLNRLRIARRARQSALQNDLRQLHEDLARLQESTGDSGRTGGKLRR